jgi:[ribosomal protein S5]-alanine N-acetyltransferase
MFSTDRLILRRWIEADLEPFARMNRDPAVMEFFPRTQTPEESAAMVQRTTTSFEERGYGRFALELKTTGEFIGFTGFSWVSSSDHWFAPCVEIGWRLKKEAWGFGLATEAAQFCLDYGFLTLGLHEIYSYTSLLNKRSENVMRKLGMTRAGEFEHPMIEPGHVLRPHVVYKILAPVS